MCAWWVPCLLTSEQKAKFVKICSLWAECLEKNLLYFENVIRMDETWMYLYDPQLQQRSTRWRQKGTEPPLKEKATRSALECLVIKFFDMQSVVYTLFVPSKTLANTANAAH